MHKTRLAQNNKAKHTSNAKQKHEGERERERKSDKITLSPFPSTPYKNLFVQRTLDPTMKGKS